MHGELGHKLVSTFFPVVVCRLHYVSTDPGSEQVQHAKRTQTLPTLPPYQTELVRAVVREVRDLDRDVARILEPFSVAVVDEEGNSTQQNTFDPSEHPETACALLVDHLSMRRDKRCLLAYHRVRAEKLEAMAWEGRDLLDEMRKDDGELTGDEKNNPPSNALSPE